MHELKDTIIIFLQNAKELFQGCSFLQNILLHVPDKLSFFFISVGALPKVTLRYDAILVITIANGDDQASYRRVTLGRPPTLMKSFLFR